MAPTFYGGKPFLPPDLRGDVLWLRADLEPTTTADVARWLDLSGNVDHVGQDVAGTKPALTGKRLVFTAAGSTTLGGPVVAGIDNGYTVGVALRYRAIVGNLAAIENGAGADGVRIGSFTNRIQLHAGVNQAFWGASTTAPETWVFRHTGASALADFALNGAHQVQQALANNVAPTGAFTIGGRAASNYSDVDVYAVIAYATRLNDADTLQLSQYLTDLRNGITPTVAVPGVPIAHFERPDRYAGPHLSFLADQCGAFDVSEAVPANRPVLIPYGPNTRPYLHFDAVNDRLQNVAFTDTQTTHVFVVAMPSETGVAGSYLLDGTIANIRALYTSATPALVMRAGAVMESPGTTDHWHYYEARFRGFQSRIITDSGTPVTGNAGPGVATALTLGAAGNLGAFGDCRIAEVVICSDQQSLRNISALNTYFAQRYGL